MNTQPVSGDVFLKEFSALSDAKKAVVRTVMAILKKKQGGKK